MKLTLDKIMEGIEELKEKYGEGYGIVKSDYFFVQDMLSCITTAIETKARKIWEERTQEHEIYDSETKPKEINLYSGFRPEGDDSRDLSVVRIMYGDGYAEEYANAVLPLLEEAMINKLKEIPSRKAYFSWGEVSLCPGPYTTTKPVFHIHLRDDLLI